jgi:hypothetical protein
MVDMLAAAYCADGSADREQWRFDNWAAVCAAIGAAHDVTSGVANSLLTDAVVVRERLPKLGAVFAAGTISYRLVHLICQRTMLVRDPDAVAALDVALAEVLAGCGALSVDAATTTVDALVLTLDPFAVRRTQAKSGGHRVDVYLDDASGSAHVDASVSVTDGKAFDDRITALARTVCHRDPRTLDERRSAAVGALGFGWDRLHCLCGSPQCTAELNPASGGIVVHVIARQDVIDAATDGPNDRGPSGGGDGGPSDDGPSDDGGDGRPGGGDEGPDGGGAGGGEPMPEPPADDAEVDSDEPPADEELDSDDAADSEAASVESEEEFEDAPAPATTPATHADQIDDDPIDPIDTIDAVDSGGAPAESDPGPVPIGDLRAQRRALIGGPQNRLPHPLSAYSWSGLLAAINADPGQLCPARPGVILGGTVVPAPVIAHAAIHATIRPLIHPGQAPPEPRYRPSTTLAEFVRCRDMTCRFPGCTRPATITDIDHTIPYPCGPTQASNLKCLCRPHHLLKTFWPGWSDRQMHNGDVIWTDPDGHTYLTHPGSKLLFPELCAPTAEVHSTGPPPTKHTAGLTMPRRATTRHHDRATRIDTERRANTPDVIQRLRQSLAPF